MSLSLCLCVRLPLSLSACLPVYLPACLSTCLPVCLSPPPPPPHPPLCISVRLGFCPAVSVSSSVSVCLCQSLLTKWHEDKPQRPLLQWLQAPERRRGPHGHVTGNQPRPWPLSLPRDLHLLPTTHPHADRHSLSCPAYQQDGHASAHKSVITRKTPTSGQRLLQDCSLDDAIRQKPWSKDASLRGKLFGDRKLCGELQLLFE